MPKEEVDNFYMRRCLELAELGRQFVAPNPMVGAVLVFQDRIIGEGFHQRFGEAHAEVNAIHSVKKSDRHLIPKSTLYVSLEPCSHHGKTPPCSDLIVENNIPKVIIACTDSFSEVAGKGIQKLRDSGVDVKVGMLEKQARELNNRFFTFHEQKRPYIILKWAQTRDGFLDRERKHKKAEINWITQSETQQLTHQWRAEEAGILVGHQTIVKDNPSLTVRAVDGKNPVRIILSSKDSIPSDANILNKDAETIFFNIRNKSLTELLEDLYNKDIQSVIVEGGSKTLQLFLDHNIWDEARVLIGSKNFKTGISAPSIRGKLTDRFTFGKDLIQLYENA
ncbi:bifunctional diaminohydroxyphosphoribosylaminopyrimidine deaminase/5-amino-6-(5-phosphoribosylamino)uracil reductase RibD [Parvicella tangerina]|nr:bifunctional diaminohydroxyphosphoribosylaminopyrimidine deaminase/5-amino-6-(5-phosphoribosylamino)uracil reductase RibD [Parvicella tangerina]